MGRPPRLADAEEEEEADEVNGEEDVPGRCGSGFELRGEDDEEETEAVSSVVAELEEEASASAPLRRTGFATAEASPPFPHGGKTRQRAANHGNAMRRRAMLTGMR